MSKVRQDPPIKIHTHSRLAEMTGLIDSMNEDQLNFIDKIESLNIESRYPDYRNNISKFLNEEVCTNLIKETDKIRTWIKERL